MGKDIYEEFDSIYFDKAEFENVEDSLSEIEIKRLNKNLKKRIFKYDKKYIKAAAIASITLIIGASVMTPAFAKTIVQYIPAMESLYGKLGYYSEYKDFSQYIGESKEDKGYKFTIDKLVADQDTVLVALRITKPGLNNKLKEKDSQVDFIMTADLTGMDRGTIAGGGLYKRVVDENTSLVLLENEAVVGKTLPKRFNMNLNIFSTSNEGIKVDFQLPVSREKIEEETIVKKSLGMSEIEDKFKINLSEIKVSPLNTKIKYSIDKSNDENTFVSFYCYDDKGNIYLDMGGRADDSNEKSGVVSGIEKNANKLYIVPYIMQYASKEEKKIESFDFVGKLYDVNTIREFNFKEDGKINVYNIEKKGEKIKFYYTFVGPEGFLGKQDIIQLYELKGNNQDTARLKEINEENRDDIALISKKDIKMYKPDLSKPNNYCIEFTNIDLDKNYVYSVGCVPVPKMITGDKIEVNLSK
ncbi:hypothetical protein CSC2_09560 [Clostridium zeae]|uniref:DUF4179 domain-containing protein n=1 Tax=Clostridium zeae TaxID=2759022 RepID=A0ABQ1E6P1_9CLOT|nr:DUF4179 domain-containing protein [Clostridium zeae]GFZ30430.1 hypothetical protein CSC2_09560 [Clostridium zeae]